MEAVFQGVFSEDQDLIKESEVQLRSILDTDPEQAIEFVMSRMRSDTARSIILLTNIFKPEEENTLVQISSAFHQKIKDFLMSVLYEWNLDDYNMEMFVNCMTKAATFYFNCSQWNSLEEAIVSRESTPYTLELLSNLIKAGFIKTNIEPIVQEYYDKYYDDVFVLVFTNRFDSCYPFMLDNIDQARNIQKCFIALFESVAADEFTNIRYSRLFCEKLIPLIPHIDPSSRSCIFDTLERLCIRECSPYKAYKEIIAEYLIKSIIENPIDSYQELSFLETLIDCFGYGDMIEQIKQLSLQSQPEERYTAMLLLRVVSRVFKLDGMVKYCLLCDSIPEIRLASWKAVKHLEFDDDLRYLIEQEQEPEIISSAIKAIERHISDEELIELLTKIVPRGTELVQKTVLLVLDKRNLAAPEYAATIINSDFSIDTKVAAASILCNSNAMEFLVSSYGLVDTESFLMVLRKFIEHRIEHSGIVSIISDVFNQHQPFSVSEFSYIQFSNENYVHIPIPDTNKYIIIDLQEAQVISDALDCTSALIELVGPVDDLLPYIRKYFTFFASRAISISALRCAEKLIGFGIDHDVLQMMMETSKTDSPEYGVLYLLVLKKLIISIDTMTSDELSSVFEALTDIYRLIKDIKVALTEKDGVDFDYLLGKHTKLEIELVKTFISFTRFASSDQIEGFKHFYPIQESSSPIPMMLLWASLGDPRILKFIDEYSVSSDEEVSSFARSLKNKLLSM